MVMKAVKYNFPTIIVILPGDKIREAKGVPLVKSAEFDQPSNKTVVTLAADRNWRPQERNRAMTALKTAFLHVAGRYLLWNIIGRARTSRSTNSFKNDNVLTYLTSFPRSGSTLLSFLVEAYTGRPVAGVELLPSSVINASGIGDSIDMALPFNLAMTHEPGAWPKYDDGKNAHVVLCRHPVEVCVSFWISSGTRDTQASIIWLNGGGESSELRGLFRQHAAVVAAHRAWRGPNYWVEYDDLVVDPMTVLRHLEPCIGKDIDRASDLLTNLESYTQRLLDWKRQFKDLPVVTGGKDLQFFRSRLNDETKRRLQG